MNIKFFIKDDWGLKKAILFTIVPLFVLVGAIVIYFNYISAQDSQDDLINTYKQQRAMELKFISNIPALKTFIIDLNLGLSEEAAFFKQELQEALRDFFSDPNVPKQHKFSIIDINGNVLLQIINAKGASDLSETFVNNNLVTIESQILNPINKNKLAQLSYTYNIPLNQLFKNTKKIMWANILLGFFSICVLYILFYLVIDFYIKPLDKLNTSVAKMITGNLKQKIAPVGFGETRHLSQSFEKMRHELEQSFDKINAKNTELLNLLYIDQLTNLGSRAKLLDDLGTSSSGAIIIIDINSFRTINELYGVQVGNEVLVSFARTLERFAIPKGYKVYRLSGDEFVLFENEKQTDLISCNMLLAELFRFISSNLPEPSSLDERIYLDISAGASQEMSKPLESANIALNHAKQHFYPYCIYSDEIDVHSSVENVALWKKKIILGIQKSAFMPFFQPIVDRKGQVVKYEALMRYRDDTKTNPSYISPQYFLEIAFATRYYNKISQITLLKSLSTCIKNNIQVSLNLSYQDIINTELSHILYKTIHKNAIGHNVVFEIVESQDIQDYTILKEFIRDFRALGVKFAIDDFGTGFSNFTHIIELSPDFIKIDGSLIKNIDTDQKSFELLKVIVLFCKPLHMKTIAEFVHSQKVFQIAFDLGVDFFQGYYFGTPELFQNASENSPQV